MRSGRRAALLHEMPQTRTMLDRLQSSVDYDSNVRICAHILLFMLEQRRNFGPMETC